MKIDTRKIAFIAPVAAIAALAGCNSGGGSSGSGTSTEGAHAKAEASALQNSGTTKLTEKEAQTLAAQCLPGASTDLSKFALDLVLHKNDRQRLLTCVKIPRANWQPAGNCVITNYHQHPLPKAKATVAEKQARHQALESVVAPCVLRYHEGASASPSAVPAGTPATATPSKAAASAKASS